MRSGNEHAQRREFAQAEQLYRRALALEPASVPARKNLATVLWFQDRKAEAEREFGAVMKQAPRDPVPHLYVGLAAHSRKQFAAAALHFQQAGPLALDNPEVLPAVLEAFLATRDTAVPQRLLAQLESAGSPDPELALRVAALFVQYGRPDAAVTALEKLVSSGEAGAEVWPALAHAYDQAGRPQAAYGAYNRVLANDPRSEQAYLDLARFAAAHQNRPFAMEVIEKGLRNLPGSAKLLLEQGLLMAMEGDRARAEAAFAKAAQADSHSNLPLLAAGVLLLESGEVERAAERFRGAARIDPRDFRAEYLYATALGRMPNQDAARASQTAAALRRAIALNPKDANCRAALGKAYLSMKRNAEGIRELEQALKLDPGNLTALYQLGLAYQAQGSAERAQPLLQKFRELKGKAREEETAPVQIMRIVRGQ
ncbi:MAG TPA: tetratricopeptide repeat protein [Bryobacteraceae bacterium]|nr:tetratricopeptide repeat protein [Bryobacteraceae bacterium]